MWGAAGPRPTCYGGATERGTTERGATENGTVLIRVTSRGRWAADRGIPPHLTYTHDLLQG